MSKKILCNKGTAKNNLFVIFIILLIFNPCISLAKMSIIPDTELSQIYGRGLSVMDDEDLDKISGQASIGLSDMNGFANVHVRQDGDMHIVQAELKLQIELYASIEKLKMGYYDLPSNSKPGAYIGMWPIRMWVFNDSEYLSKWDIDFENVQMGEDPTNPVSLGGLIIRADFKEVNGAKILKRFIIGSDDVTGRMYIQKPKGFTGLMNNGLAKGGNFLLDMMDPSWTRRTYILNGEGHGSMDSLTLTLGDLKHVGQEGMDFKGKNEEHGFHIIFDSEHGVGVWAGFPISNIDSGTAFEFED